MPAQRRRSGKKGCKRYGCTSGKPAEYRDLRQEDFSKKYLCTVCGQEAQREGEPVVANGMWQKAMKRCNGDLQAVKVDVTHWQKDKKRKAEAPGEGAGAGSGMGQDKKRALDGPPISIATLGLAAAEEPVAAEIAGKCRARVEEAEARAKDAEAEKARYRKIAMDKDAVATAALATAEVAAGPLWQKQVVSLSWMLECGALEATGAALARAAAAEEQVEKAEERAAAAWRATVRAEERAAAAEARAAAAEAQSRELDGGAEQDAVEGAPARDKERRGDQEEALV